MRSGYNGYIKIVMVIVTSGISCSFWSFRFSFWAPMVFADGFDHFKPVLFRAGFYILWLGFLQPKGIFCLRADRRRFLQALDMDFSVNYFHHWIFIKGNWIIKRTRMVAGSEWGGAAPQCSEVRAERKGGMDEGALCLHTPLKPGSGYGRKKSKASAGAAMASPHNYPKNIRVYFRLENNISKKLV